MKIIMRDIFFGVIINLSNKFTIKYTYIWEGIMSDEVKINLSEKDMPKFWYNICADLPTPFPPPLHPGTLNPIGPDDLAPLFPMDLIMQEVSHERDIEIPEPVICKDLLEEGAILNIHDPKVEPQQIENDLGREQIKQTRDQKDIEKVRGGWIYIKDIYKAAEAADAIIILTEWDEYTKINWRILSKVMRKPSWVFDYRSIVNPNQVINSGLNLWRIGDGSLNF